MTYSNSLNLLMSRHMMGVLQLVVTQAEGNARNLMKQVSKYILSFFVDQYSVSVVIVAPPVATDRFFANCGCPNFFVDVITTHCHSHRQLKGSHFCEQRPYEMVSKVFVFYSNDSSEYSKCSSPSAIFFIILLIATKDKMFAAQGLT